MSNGVVATQTANSIGVAVVAGINGLNHVGVAAATGVFCYVAASVADFYVVRKISSSEVEGMEESVAGFNGVFAREVVRSVAVVAGGGVLMASFDPAIVLRIHNVAVRASLRIIGEIGIALGVDERITAKPNHRSNENREQQRDRDGFAHRPFQIRNCLA